MQLREALGDLPDTVFADLLESDDGYLLVVDLPGATPETVDVTVDDETLRIEARREKSFPDSFDYVTEERALFLDVELPLPPDATGVDGEGEVEKGVLSIRLPKAAEDGSRRVPVS